MTKKERLDQIVYIHEHKAYEYIIRGRSRWAKGSPDWLEWDDLRILHELFHQPPVPDCMV
jgi:hypothetical protein